MEPANSAVFEGTNLHPQAMTNVDETASIKYLEQLAVANPELTELVGTVKEASGVIQTVVETVTNTDDTSSQNKQQLIERMIEISLDHLVHLNTQLNTFVPINRLPIELLTYIIFLTKLSIEEEGKEIFPHVPYTWVCHHWRSAIIENPNFWTSIRVTRITHFLDELIRRSKSAQLDVIILDPLHSSQLTTLENLFTKGSDRIRTLQLKFNCEGLLQSVLSSNIFPSLRSLVLGKNIPHHIFIAMLPAFVSSAHLETFQCTLAGNIPLDYFAPIFGRLRNLSLDINSTAGHAAVEFLLDLLKASINLRDLRLTSALHGPSSYIVLPELRSLSVNDSALLRYFKTPKLSTLVATWRTHDAIPLINYPSLMELDLSLIKYLYIYPIGILGSNGRLHKKSLFSNKTKCFFDDAWQENFALKGLEMDILTEVIPSDCFRLQFDDGGIMAPMVRPALSLLLPRMKGLCELYISPYHFPPPSEWEIINLRQILTLVPSLEKLSIKHIDTFLDFIQLLSDNSLLPRLKHLSYCTFSNHRNPIAESFWNIVGKALTKCLQSRQKESVHKLELIFLKECPSLPDSWDEELEKLGTKVFTL